MKNVNFAILAICCLLALYFFQKWSTEEAPVSLKTPWSEVVEYARVNLPTEGKLVVKSDGYGYIKVDDNYIYALFPMLGLKQEGYRIPPYFRNPSSPGAHISVFYADEHVIPSEVERTFHFEPVKIEIVKASKDTSYAVLQVRAPELEKLREKYGLSPKLFGHEFHISLGVKHKRT